MVAVRGAEHFTSGRPTNPVTRAAEEFDLPTIYLYDLDSTESIERLRALNAHLGIVVNFGMHLPVRLRKAFTLGCIEVHASFPPKHHGLKPITSALLKEDKKAEISILTLTEPLNPGPILVQ